MFRNVLRSTTVAALLLAVDGCASVVGADFNAVHESKPPNEPKPPNVTDAGTETDGAAREHNFAAFIEATSADPELSPRPVLVVPGSYGSTTIDWYVAYGPDYFAIVWFSYDAGQGDTPYAVFGCNPSANATGTAEAGWIGAGATYHFSLRPTPTKDEQGNPLSCDTTRSDFPEAAAVTVKGYTDYIIAKPNPCVASTGICATELHWGTSSPAPWKRIMQSINGVSSEVACIQGSVGKWPAPVDPGPEGSSTYSFELWPVDSCADALPAAPAATDVTAVRQ